MPRGTVRHLRLTGVATVSDDDPDDALLRRVAAGDQTAYRALVAQKLPRVHGLALRMLGNRGDADEIAQEALLRGWRQAPRWVPGRARFDTWLHRVVLNLCTDRLRRRREIATDAPPEQIDPAPLPDQCISRDETAERVRTALARLPDRQREAIMLHTYQDMSNIEIASTLEISVDAAESLLARARRTLRTVLDGAGPEGCGS